MSEGRITPGFLLSTERSGSNLVRSILNTHSDVTAPHPLETAYPWRVTASPASMSPARRRSLVRDILVNKNYSFHPLVEALDIDRVHERLEASAEPSFLDVQSALYEEFADITGASHWFSKDPGQWDYVEEALDHYDDLNIVYLVRDARDVVLSFENSNVGKYHPYYNAHLWNREQKAGLELLEAFPNRVHRIRYEGLLQDPEGVIRGVCDHLQLPYEPEMLFYYETEDAKQTSKSAEVFSNLSSPLKSDNFDKYKEQMPRESIRLVEAIAGKTLEAHGYELEFDAETLESVDINGQYAADERRIARAAAVNDWIEHPREQVERHLSRSFTYYMILRYGLGERLPL